MTPIVVLRNVPQRKTWLQSVHRMFAHPPFFKMAAPQCGHGRHPDTPSIFSGNIVLFNAFQSRRMKPKSGSAHWCSQRKHMSSRCPLYATPMQPIRVHSTVVVP